MEGSLADPSTNYDGWPTSQKEISMKEHMNPETPNPVSTEGTTIAFWAKNKSEEEIAQATATDRVKIVSSEKTDTLDHEVLFQVLQTEVDFSANPTYRVRIGVGVDKSPLCSTTYIHNTGGRPNLVNESYLIPSCKNFIKRQDVHKLRTARKESI